VRSWPMLTRKSRSCRRAFFLGLRVLSGTVLDQRWFCIGICTPALSANCFACS
jgi:hypothetical protein